MSDSKTGIVYPNSIKTRGVDGRMVITIRITKYAWEYLSAKDCVKKFNEMFLKSYKDHVFLYQYEIEDTWDIQPVDEKYNLFQPHHTFDQFSDRFEIFIKRVN